MKASVWLVGTGLVFGAFTGVRDRAAAQSAAITEFGRAADSIVAADGLGRGIPGIGVAVVARGQIILARGYGVSDRTRGLRVSDSSPFNIASVTKPFTAIVALRLARRGVVSLGATPLGRWLPWVPEPYRAVTLQHLLSHTSGVVRDVRRSNDDDPDPVEYRHRVERSQPSFAAGSRFEYSNTGYTLLGWALEAAAGRGLDSLLANEIFKPLGMTTATYRAAPTGRRARPYAVTSDGSVRDTAWLTGGFGSGGIALSARDAARFAQGLQRGLVLTQDEQRVAWAPASLGDGSPIRARAVTDDDSYGLGWWISSHQGHRLLSHGGGITGYSAFLWHFPDRQLTIFVVANAKARDDGQAPVDAIIRALADLCRANPAC
mgnify:CR=1 FL=1